MAHRGASRAERENTLAAFRRAATMGAHAVELDARRCGDGTLVVHHDAVLEDGRTLVRVPLGELPGYVPTLEAALDACTPMWVNVEVKNDPREPDFDDTDRIADEVVALLRRRSEPPSHWLISSFRLETVDRCRQLAPEIPTAWLTVAADLAHLERAREHGHAAWHPWVGGLSAELVDASHAAGLAVNTWTCDDPEQMRQLITWGIDGICTNVPDVALAVLAEQSGATGQP
jgi:glycerophosphoryl diester phosphodiesterase